MKNKNYDVYMILQEDKSEYIFKYFEKDFEAREFVRKQLENDLKFFYYQTNNKQILTKRVLTTPRKKQANKRRFF